MVECELLRTQVALGRRLWVKVTGMLQQNWAVCVSSGELRRTAESASWLVDAALCASLTEDSQAVHALFFDDHGALFDQLAFDGMASAEAALTFNGFDAVARHASFLQASGWPSMPIRKGQSRPVYSSGEYWRTPESTYRRPEGQTETAPTRRSQDDLERFVDAQDAVWFDVIEELIAGRKATHWMWFVFPQLRGLGRSHMAQYFGLASLEEAEAYVEQFVLGPRLRISAELLLEHQDRSAVDIFGTVDAMKLQSFATLFSRVSASRDVCLRLLEVFFDGAPCEQTTRLLAIG